MPNPNMAALGRWAYRDWALGLVDRLSCRLGNFWAIFLKYFAGNHFCDWSRLCVGFPFCPGGEGTWVFFGWVCAARDSKLVPRSKKISPRIDTPF